MDAHSRWQSSTAGRFRRQPVRPRSGILPAAHVLAMRPGRPGHAGGEPERHGRAAPDHLPADVNAGILVDLALASLAAVALARTRCTSPPALVAELLGAASHRHPIDSAEQFRDLLTTAPDDAAVEALDAAWQLGRSAPPTAIGVVAARVLVDAAMQLAAGQLGRRPEVDELTRREREVLSLIAHGLTDREIAQRLGISRHTATTHVKRVRAKLGGGPRSAVALHAFLAGQNMGDHSGYARQAVDEDRAPQG